MKLLVVVDNPKLWPLHIPGVTVVSARSYLVDPEYAEVRGIAVYNLCRHYRYQRLGYYVSLLAAARGHRPMPSVATVQDLRLSPIIRIMSEDLDHLIQRSLAPLKSNTFELSIYFGRNVAKRYDRLAQAIFNQYPAPLLRASFSRQNDEWRIETVRIIAAHELSDFHRSFVIERMTEYFARPQRATRRRDYRFDLAILYDETTAEHPSNEGAIKKFVRAGQRHGMDVAVIGPDDYGYIAEFDALFIRETTFVNHYTYRFASRAAAAGLVVVDDPESIVRATNKVYQTELFNRQRIPTPRTLVVHSGNIDEVIPTVGLPCVLKQPDSAFSQGVAKVESEDDLRDRIGKFLQVSELAIAQEWVPSDFDWRIGVLDRRPLFAAKYHMVKGHWQIAHDGPGGDRRYGDVEAIPLEAVPSRIVKTAVRASAPFGSGLYGVDVKDLGKRIVVTEVNDNPNLDAGYEDGILKDDLYNTIMRYFLARLEQRGRPVSDRG